MSGALHLVVNWVIAGLPFSSLNFVFCCHSCVDAEQGHADADTFFYLLIVFSTISSLYTLIWDLRMDWGLFDSGAGENTFLREEIVYPHKVACDLSHTHTHAHNYPVSLIPSHLCSGLLLLCHP